MSRFVNYRPDIDGLRTIAVVPVLFYHASVAPFAGGFVGVDIFFVISGYLIMATLAADIRLGRFSVVGFYERRIRRIFPALFVMAFACMLAAAVMFTVPDFVAFGRSLIAMALFVSNVFFDWTSSPAGYFDTAVELKLLLHTWSLSVEEQFYILLPIGLVLLRRRSQRALVKWLAAMAILSFGLSVWSVAYRPVDAFYLVFPRAWELLMGALLALQAVPAPRSQSWREAGAVLGLGMIAYAIFGFSKSTPFPGLNALFPCIGASLIIHAGATGPSIVGTLLSARPIVLIGKMSYSLYLWHWPTVVVVRTLNTGDLNAPSTILIIVASFVAAYLSHTLVEQPFRRRAAVSASRRVLSAGVLIGLIGVCAGSSIVASQGFLQWRAPATRAIIAANAARETDHPLGDCSNWKKRVVSLRDIAFCPIGDDKTKKILFWGDSHVNSLRPLMRTLYDEGKLGGRGVVFTIADACPPAVSMNIAFDSGYHCQNFSRLALERASAKDIDAVFIGFSGYWDLSPNRLCRAENDRCVASLTRQEAEDLFVDDLRKAVRDLRLRGKSVIVALPAPGYNLPLPRKEINDAILGGTYARLQDIGLLRALKRNDFEALRARVASIVTEEGVTLYDPRQSLCRADGSCLFERNGISIYADLSHIANSEIGIFHDNLAEALQAALSGRR